MVIVYLLIGAIIGTGVTWYFKGKELRSAEAKHVNNIVESNNSFAKLNADMEAMKAACKKKESELIKQYDADIANYEAEIAELNKVIAELTPVDEVKTEGPLITEIVEEPVVSYVNDKIVPTKKKYFKKKASK